MGRHDDDKDKDKDKAKDKSKDEDQDQDKDKDKDKEKKKKSKHKDRDDDNDSPPPKAVPRKHKPAGRSLPENVRLSIHAAGVPELSLPSFPKLKPATKQLLQDAFWGILLCFFVPPILAFLYFNRPSNPTAPRPVVPNTPTPSMSPPKPGYHWTPPASKPSSAPHPHISHLRPSAPVRRLTITTIGNIAACYPSYGGVWAKTVAPLEIDYLGLDPMHNADRGLDQEEEDDFCESLEKLGAAWFAPRHYPAEGPTSTSRNPVGVFKPTKWRAVASSASSKIPAGVITPVHEDTTLYDADGGRFLDEAIPQLRGFEVAWPDDYGSGICVWNEKMISRRADREDWFDGWDEPAKSGIGNALTQEERCDTILRWGGKYCARRTSCPRAGRLFGVSIGDKRTSTAGHEMQRPRRQKRESKRDEESAEGRSQGGGFGGGFGSRAANGFGGAFAGGSAGGRPQGRPQAGKRRGGTIW